MISVSKTVIAIISLLLISCSDHPKETVLTVRHVGELKQIMHQGRVEARVALDTLAKSDMYALGAIAGLKGEVTIIDGKPFITKIAGDTLTIENHFANTNATLLVYSVVNDWDTLKIKGLNNLEEYLAKHTSASQPLPFQLIGTVDHLKYHVINFSGEEANFQNHKQGALNDSLNMSEVHILGFYSTEHHGIFTHHDSDVHMHFINKQRTISGHLDELALGNGDFQLLIPKK